MKALHGVTVAMVSPLDASDRVDEGALRKLTSFLIAKTVDCLYPGGTTGEMFRLSLPERKRIAEIVVEEAGKRLPVFIHVGAMRLDETVELARHAQQIGADGIGAVTPCYFTVSDREMEEYYVAVAQAVPPDFPVYLYNIPQLSANDLKPATIEHVLQRCPNVIGLKYSYADMSRTLEYLQVNGGRFSVIHGADHLFLSLLMMGCAGTVSGVASVYPEPFVAVYRAFRDGDQQRAMQYQAIGVRLSQVLKGGSNMAYYKEALRRRGIDAGHMRKPQLDLTAEERSHLTKALEAVEREFPVEWTR
ncbi:MAG TPA: dihydrodipicolinate synthase family protein [Candidatus Methylomirabilis sp.]|nr:dihydrodipicolinate synthase family protein [Candidatus Methylomirabilis sp.]